MTTTRAVYQGVTYRAYERFGTWPEITLVVEPGEPTPTGLEGPMSEHGSVVYLVDPEQLDAWYEPLDGGEAGRDLKAERRDSWQRMVAAGMFRPGTFAVHQGQIWPAGADPDDLARIVVTKDGEDHLVPLGQVDAWYTTRWTFNWRRGPFDATGVDRGWLKGTYTGGQWGFADNFMLTCEPAPDGSHNIYTLRVKLHGITDLTEHRNDLLAKWKEKHQR